MRRRVIFLSALMIALVLLTACGGDSGAREKFELFRSSAEGTKISFKADVTASFEKNTEQYTFAYSESGASAAIEVIKPDILAGIRATAKDGEFFLEYDGAVLSAGAASENGADPASALVAITGAVRSGHVYMCWEENYRERDALAASICLTDDSTATVWLDTFDMKPYYAEIEFKGDTVIFCDISDWTETNRGTE